MHSSTRLHITAHCFFTFPYAQSTTVCILISLTNTVMLLRRSLQVCHPYCLLDGPPRESAPRARATLRNLAHPIPSSTQFTGFYCSIRLLSTVSNEHHHWITLSPQGSLGPATLYLLSQQSRFLLLDLRPVRHTVIHQHHHFPDATTRQQMPTIYIMLSAALAEAASRVQRILQSQPTCGPLQHIRGEYWLRSCFPSEFTATLLLTRHLDR